MVSVDLFKNLEEISKNLDIVDRYFVEDLLKN